MVARLSRVAKDKGFRVEVGFIGGSVVRFLCCLRFRLALQIASPIGIELNPSRFVASASYRH